MQHSICCIPSAASHLLHLMQHSICCIPSAASHLLHLMQHSICCIPSAASFGDPQQEVYLIFICKPKVCTSKRWYTFCGQQKVAQPTICCRWYTCSICPAGGTPAGLLLHWRSQCSITPQPKVVVYCSRWYTCCTCVTTGGTPVVTQVVLPLRIPMQLKAALVWDLQLKAADLTRLGACT